MGVAKSSLPALCSGVCLELPGVYIVRLCVYGWRLFAFLLIALRPFSRFCMADALALPLRASWLGLNLDMSLELTRASRGRRGGDDVLLQQSGCDAIGFTPA
jgi:hypothetical protein